MFKFLCKAAGMVAVTVFILKIGEAVSARVCGKQYSIKIVRNPKEIGIIGGADGPTAVFVTSMVNPQAVTNVFGRLANVIKIHLSKIWA